jgi:hypothetical protein
MKLSIAISAFIFFGATSAFADNSICGSILCEADMMPGTPGAVSVSTSVFEGNPDPTNLNTTTAAAAPSINTSTVGTVSAASVANSTSTTGAENTLTVGADNTVQDSSTPKTAQQNVTGSTTSAGTSGLGALP